MLERILLIFRYILLVMTQCSMDERGAVGAMNWVTVKRLILSLINIQLLSLFFWF